MTQKLTLSVDPTGNKPQVSVPSEVQQFDPTSYRRRTFFLPKIT